MVRLLQIFISGVVFSLVMSCSVCAKGEPCLTEVPLDKKFEEAIQQNPQVYFDMGSYRVVRVRGELAVKLYMEFKSTTVIDHQNRFILLLDVFIPGKKDV